MSNLQASGLEIAHIHSKNAVSLAYPIETELRAGKRFNWASRKLYNRLTQLGAEAICDRAEADEQHPDG